MRRRKRRSSPKFVPKKKEWANELSRFILEEGEVWIHFRRGRRRGGGCSLTCEGKKEKKSFTRDKRDIGKRKE